MDQVLREVAEAVLPHLVEAISGILLLALGWLWNLVRVKTGLEIAEKHRLALHSALMTGAIAAIDGNLTGAKARELVIEYVKRSVPDALKALHPSGDVLVRLAEAKLADAVRQRGR